MHGTFASSPNWRIGNFCVRGTASLCPLDGCHRWSIHRCRWKPVFWRTKKGADTWAPLRWVDHKKVDTKAGIQQTWCELIWKPESTMHPPVLFVCFSLVMPFPSCPRSAACRWSSCPSGEVVGRSTSLWEFKSFTHQMGPKVSRSC